VGEGKEKERKERGRDRRCKGVFSKTVALLLNSLRPNTLLVPALIHLKAWLKICKLFGHSNILNSASGAF